MGLILAPSLMVISTMGILLYAEVSPLYNVLWEWFCCCLHVNYIVYKCFDRGDTSAYNRIPMVDMTIKLGTSIKPITNMYTTGLNVCKQQQTHTANQLKSVRVHLAAGSEALRGTHAVMHHNWHD